MMTPATRVLIHRVKFLVQMQQPTGRFDVVSIGTMDYSGHIDISSKNPEFSRNVMMNLEMAEEHNVGDNELELFATRAFLNPAKAALIALPQGWTDWDPDADRGKWS